MSFSPDTPPTDSPPYGGTSAERRYAQLVDAVVATSETAKGMGPQINRRSFGRFTRMALAAAVIRPRDEHDTSPPARSKVAEITTQITHVPQDLEARVRRRLANDAIQEIGRILLPPEPPIDIAMVPPPEQPPQGTGRPL